MTSKPFRVEKIGQNVHTIKLHCDGRKPQDFWFLLRADVHHDSLLCDQDLERKHLVEAQRRKAGVFTFGDLYDCMNSKWDPRKDQDQLRPEHRGNNYLDLLTDTAADFYEPFANNMLVLGYGNHELTILDRYSHDLLEALASKLRQRTGCGITTSGISGYIRFVFTRGTSNGKPRHLDSRTLWFHHGGGSCAAPVTKGVISASRRASYIADADVVVSGHRHEEWIFPIARISLSGSNKIEHSRQLHIQIPGYKDDFGNGAFGWSNIKEHAPKSKGSCWLRFHVQDDHISTEATLTMDH